MAAASDGDKPSELLQKFRLWASTKEPYDDEGIEALFYDSKPQRYIADLDAVVKPCTIKLRMASTEGPGK